MNNKLKRIVSVLLITAMVMTNSGFSAFAEGLGGQLQTQATDVKGEDLSKKYYEEQDKENLDSGKDGSKDNAINSSSDDKKENVNTDDTNSVEKTKDDSDDSEKEEDKKEDAIDTSNDNNKDDSNTDITTSTDSDADFDGTNDDVESEDDADVDTASISEAFEMSTYDAERCPIATKSAVNNEDEIATISEVSINNENNELFGTGTYLGEYNIQGVFNGGSNSIYNFGLGSNWYTNFGFTKPKAEIEEIIIEFKNYVTKASASQIPACDEYKKIICTVAGGYAPPVDTINRIDSEHAFWWVYRVGSSIHFDIIRFNIVNNAGRWTGSWYNTIGSIFENENNQWAGWSSLKKIEMLGTKMCTTFYFNNDQSPIKNLSNYFSGCPNLETINIREMFVSGCTTAESMFEGCSHLKTATIGFKGASSITNAKKMFKGCTALTSPPDLSVLTGLQNGESMFEGCTGLESAIMPTFTVASNLQTLFKDCTNLKSVKVNTDVRQIPAACNATNMFFGCNSLVGGGGFKYDPNFADGTYARVDYGGIYPGYFTCTDDSLLENLNIRIDSTWCNNVNKANIKKIKFSTSSVMEAFNGNFSFQTTMNNTLGYFQDGGDTIYIHFARQLKSLKTIADWTGFFKGFSSLESIEGLDHIDTSVVTGMKEVFKDCSRLQTISLGNFNIKNVTTIESAFENCSALTTFTGTIASFSNLTSAKNAFRGCKALQAFNFDVCDTTSLTDVTGMFASCSNLTRIYADDNFQGLPAAALANSAGMFAECTHLVGGEGFSYNQSAPITDGSVANVDYGGIKPGYFTIQDTSKYANASFTLPNDWYDLNAEAVKPKSEITKIKFYNDAVGIGNFNQDFYMSNTDSTRFYVDGNTVKIHYGHMMPKLKVEGDWSGFFKSFTNLTSIEGLDKIDTSNVTSMRELFKDCRKLQSVSLGNVNIKNVTTLESAFENCERLTTLTGIVASFSNLTNAKNAFKNCASLTAFKFDIYHTPILTDVSGMFASCSNLSKIYVDDSFQGLGAGVITTDMFKNCTKLAGGQGFIYNSTDPDANGSKYACVDYGGIKPGYFTISGTEQQIREKYSHAQFNLPQTWFDSAVAGGINKDDVVKIKFYNDAATGTGTGIGHYDGSYLMSTTENTTGYYENEKDASGNPTGKVIAKIHFGNLLPNLKVGADFSGFFKDFKNVKRIEGIEKLNLQAVEDMKELFSGCESLESITLTPNISLVKDMEKVFYNCKNLTSVDLGVNVNLGNVETLESAFENCEKLTTAGINIRSTVPLSHIRTFKNTFKNCKSLTAFQMNVGNAATLTDLEGMFNGCEKLTTINASSINLTNVTSTKEMFSGCKKLRTLTPGSNAKLDVVTNLEKMFYDCESLTAVPPIHITSDRITTMKAMFASCSNITQVGIASAKTNNLASDGLVDMFLNCKKLTNVVFGNGFVLGNATDLTNMFNGCENLTSLDLSNFSSNKITNVTDMFKNNKKLAIIVASSSFVVKGKTGNEMFLNCDNLVGESGTSYKVASVNNSSYAQIDKGASDPGYFSWNSVTLTFLPGSGGTGTMNPMKVTRGVATNVKCSFTNAGYASKNWVDESGNKYGINITPSRSMTLTVEWQKVGGTGNYRGSGGPGGGGGGGGRGAGIPAGIIGASTLDFVVHTLITLAEHRWVYDEKGERVGIEIRKDSTLGKAFANSTQHASHWQPSTDENYIKLKNGFYIIEYAGGGYYFAFDNNAKLMTGFVQTTATTEHRYIDVTNYQFTDSFSMESAKYLLYDGTGFYRGIIWSIPITINNVLYTFDEQGRVAKEEKIDVTALSQTTKGDGSKWEYNPDTGTWRYYHVDNNGKGDYYINGVYPIEYLGETQYYVFDSEGNLETGLKEIDGNTYYLQETGNFIGAVYVGKITLNGKDYEFDAGGRMVSAMSGTEKQ